MGLEYSEKFFLQELSDSAKKAKKKMKGLSIGPLIKIIRNQLGMTQKNLSKRASVPQSTIIRIEC